MTIVIDSSITLAWYFEDERTEESTVILRRVADEGAIVPMIWPLEVANGLQTAVRRRRITADYRDASLNELQLLPITIDPSTYEHAWTDTLKLSERFNLTVYDAAYLELALRCSLALASLDGELIRAAANGGVRVIGS